MVSIKILGMMTAMMLVMSLGLVAAEIGGPIGPPPCDPEIENCDDNGENGDNGEFNPQEYLDLVCPPNSSNWNNHGGYVSCVAHNAQDLVNQGLITSEEKGDLVSAAAQSCIGMPPQAACN